MASDISNPTILLMLNPFLAWKWGFGAIWRPWRPFWKMAANIFKLIQNFEWKSQTWQVTYQIILFYCLLIDFWHQNGFWNNMAALAAILKNGRQNITTISKFWKKIHKHGKWYIKSYYSIDVKSISGIKMGFWSNMAALAAIFQNGRQNIQTIWKS